MTSKNLFFKLMREDLKRRIWALGLAFLSFFFGMPVAAAMGASSISQSYQRWVAEGATFYGGTVSPEVERYNRMTELAEQIVGIHNVFIVCIIMAAAVVLGLTGFMYLHSKKQVDFYNSLPVRRELLYAVKYIDGILMILFMYLLNLLFAVGVFLANGLPLSVFLTGSLTAFAVHMTGFLLIYGLTTIAVLLTGNFFVSILGGIVLHSLIPSLVLTVYVLMSLFFMTINYRGTDVLQRIAVNGSPFSYYISLVGDGMGLSLIPAIPAVERGMALISAVPAAGLGSLAGRMAAGLLAAVLMAISFVLISNTIRLLIYSKRFLIHTMQLVGATAGFIRWPFVRYNLISGFIASVLAICMLTGALYYLQTELAGFIQLLDIPTLLVVYGAVLVLGLLISAIATILSVNKYLRMSFDRLYYI